MALSQINTTPNPIEQTQKINEIAINTPIYCTSSTVSSTAAKIASTSSDFVLSTGTRIYVLFSENDSSSNPTLNVNGTGAYSIRYKGANITKFMIRNSIPADFVFNGTHWILMNPQVYTYNATIPTSGWSGPNSQGYYYISINTPGVSPNFDINVSRVLNLSSSTSADNIQSAWNLIIDAQCTTNDAITFYAKELPTTAIPITYITMI